MNCYFQHRLFLILCVCISVCVCLTLINCSPKIKRSHFLLVTPATWVQLQDGCVFLWPAVKLGGCKRRARDVIVHWALCSSLSDLNDQSGHTHTGKRQYACKRSVKVMCIILFMREWKLVIMAITKIVALSHLREQNHQGYKYGIFSPTLITAPTSKLNSLAKAFWTGIKRRTSTITFLCFSTGILDSLLP